MRSASRFGSLLIFAPLLSLPLACGGVDYKLAPVSGHVTMDSRPLANATISFYSNGASEFPASTGRTDDEGNFKLETFDRGANRDGAVIGESRVVISINVQNAGKKIDPARKQGMGRPRSAETGDLVPARYNTETTLKFTVPPDGSDQANFALSSKAH
jgi:hypothetical protein